MKKEPKKCFYNDQRNRKKPAISKATRNLIHMCPDILETKTIEFVFACKNMLVSSGPVIIKVLIMFAGVLGLTQTHFSPSHWLMVKIKGALRRAQNIIMPNNINSNTIVITLEGIEKIKTEKKMTAKQSQEYPFHQGCKKT